MQRYGLLLGIVIVCQFSLPAFADSAGLEKMQKYADNKGEVPALLTGSRGGPSTKKPLGFYASGMIAEKENRTYHSGYEKQSAGLTGRFANDLYEFLVKHGGGFENCEKDKDKKAAGIVPYPNQDKFASDWWAKNCPAYPAKDKAAGDKWVQDALVDATVLWTTYEKTSMKLPKGKTADADKYMDAGRDQYHLEALMTVLTKSGAI